MKMTEEQWMGPYLAAPRRTRRELVYIAQPYSAPSYLSRIDQAKVRDLRATGGSKYLQSLMARNVPAFSPIEHSHRAGEIVSQSHEYYMAIDLPILWACSSMHVLCMAGWEESRGVAEEMHEARAAGIPIVFIAMRLYPELAAIDDEVLRTLTAFTYCQAFAEKEGA